MRLGLGAGQWRTGLLLALIGVPIAVLVAYGSRGSAALAAVYPLGSPSLAIGSFAPHVLGYLLYYIAYEYFFRGFMLLGLEDRLGPKAANALQAGIVTLAHLGKPPIELLAAYPASLLFGWMTLKTRAVWSAVAVHWAVGVALDYFLLAGP
jgi:membrane protease YdiL (CAAX protease family)